MDHARICQLATVNASTSWQRQDTGAYRHFQGPEFPAQLAVELHGHLGGDTHHGLFLADRTLQDALGGNGVVNTAELLNCVVAILAV